MKAILQENKIIGTYSPDEAVFIGSAAAKYSKRIAIGRNGDSRAAEMALSAGIIASGSDVISDRKSTRLNSSHIEETRMPSSA